MSGIHRNNLGSITRCYIDSKVVFLNHIHSHSSWEELRKKLGKPKEVYYEKTDY